MAQEVRHFTATCPAGTAQNTPAVLGVSFPPRVVRSIDWRVPNGPMGVFGWRLTMGGVQVLPTAGDPWVLANDEHGTWTPDNAPDSGAWQVTAYNTGAHPHAVYLAFHLDPVIRPPKQVVLIPAAVLGSAPDLAQVLPPLRRPGR